MPGAKRKASGMLVTPERRISSPVMTKIAAGASAILSSCLETELTRMLLRSSRLIWASSETRFVDASRPIALGARRTESSQTTRRKGEPLERPTEGCRAAPALTDEHGFWTKFFMMSDLQGSG